VAIKFSTHADLTRKQEKKRKKGQLSFPFADPLSVSFTVHARKRKKKKEAGYPCLIGKKERRGEPVSFLVRFPPNSSSIRIGKEGYGQRFGTC